MIDLHCHILPGVDDGAQTLEDSIAMAHAAVAEGITHILVTPHHDNGRYFNKREDIIDKMKALQLEFEERQIPLTLFPGQEVRITGELIESIQKGDIQFVDEEQQYLLIEFPTMTIPQFSEELFFQLNKSKITPIIVHPERNQVFIDNPDRLGAFIERGALAQLTAGSYLGYFGKKIEKISKQMVEANLIHIIASDAHNVTTRTFHLKEAYAKLEKNVGIEKVVVYKQHAKDLINGETISSFPISKVKKHKFLGLF